MIKNQIFHSVILEKFSKNWRIQKWTDDQSSKKKLFRKGRSHDREFSIENRYRAKFPFPRNIIYQMGKLFSFEWVHFYSNPYGQDTFRKICLCLRWIKFHLRLTGVAKFQVFFLKKLVLFQKNKYSNSKSHENWTQTRDLEVINQTYINFPIRICDA